jgi:hypothetical protein
VHGVGGFGRRAAARRAGGARKRRAEQYTEAACSLKTHGA